MIPTLPNGEPQKGPVPTTHANPPGHATALRQLRPQSPKESLGLTAQSGLLKATVLAGIGFAVLLAALTVGPYFLDKSSAAAKANAPAPAEKVVDTATEKPAAAPAPAAPAAPEAASAKLPATAPATAGKQPASKGDIVDKLGENVTKTAPAKVNPLDKKDDDLLKDLK